MATVKPSSNAGVLFVVVGAGVPVPVGIAWVSADTGVAVGTDTPPFIPLIAKGERAVVFAS